MTEPTVASAATPATRPRVPVRVRRARLGDVGRLVRMYLSLTPEARHGYHPFPFQRGLLWMIYPTLVAYQSLLRPVMRRFPRTTRILVVAELEGQAEPVGSGTLRGVVPKGEEPRVRFGFVVREGYRGYGIGKSLLQGLSEEGVALGFRWGIGAVHRSDEQAIRVIKGFGFQFRPTDYRDKGAPSEENFATLIDLNTVVRAPLPYPAAAS